MTSACCASFCPKNAKSGRHHRCNTAKMARTRCAFELLGKTLDVDVRRKPAWINLFNCRREDVIDIVIGQQRGVFGQIARVALEVLTWAKLSRIHKHRDHHYVAHPSRFADEAQVSIVQGAHRGNEADGFVLFTADFARDGSHALTAVNDLHSLRLESGLLGF